MSGKMFWSLVAVSALTLTAGPIQGSPYDRVAYYDASSGVAWAGGGVTTVRDALQQAGYKVVNAAELKTWMDGHIADKKLSVVVMCQDVVPTTVAETMTATCTIRRYLDAGGKVVWYSDWPFYYCGTTGTTWGSNGAVQVLGFNAATGPNDGGQLVTITDLGRRWGLTTPWPSRRPTSPTVTSNLDVLAKDNNGNAAGWVKHYVPGDTFRGFVRIEDHDGAPINVAQLMAVAEYYVTITTASGPAPSDGAHGRAAGCDVELDGGAISFDPRRVLRDHVGRCEHRLPDEPEGRLGQSGPSRHDVRSARSVRLWADLLLAGR